LNSLRLREGFSVEMYEQRTNLDFSQIAHTVDKMISKGLMRRVENNITTTDSGFSLIDTILGEFS
jgi:coproporphyrinogen III oxidase-like Fe-S oxidoreductase